MTWPLRWWLWAASPGVGDFDDAPRTLTAIGQAISAADKDAQWEAQILAGTWTPPADRDDDDILTN